MDSVSTELSSELSVFEDEFINDAIISKYLEPKHPVTSIGDNVNAPIDFIIDGTEQAIRPHECFIHISATLTGQRTRHTPAVPGDNAQPAHTETADVMTNGVLCSIVNNIGHSLFSKVSVKFGNRDVSTLQHYPYVSFINTRLNFNKASLDSFARLSGWLSDLPTDLNSTDSANNAVLKERKSWFSEDGGEGNIDLIIQPFSPFFMMQKILLPFIPISVRLERVTNPEFYLQYPAPATEGRVAISGSYKIKVSSAVFYTQRLELTAEYAIGLEKALSRNLKSVVYKMPEPQVQAYNVPPNLENFDINNIFNSSIIPDKIIVMFVAAAAFNGSSHLNPFDFTHANISSIGLLRNGIPFPHPPINMNFAKKQVALPYQYTLKALMAPSPAGPCLTMDEFINGTTIFAFDTSPDPMAGTQMSTQNSKTSNMRLEVKFATAPTIPLVCLIYFERELRVEVDSNRNISVLTLY